MNDEISKAYGESLNILRDLKLIAHRGQGTDQLATSQAMIDYMEFLEKGELFMALIMSAKLFAMSESEDFPVHELLTLPDEGS